MARISKDQLRQLITDGRLSRSPYPKKNQPSSPAVPQQPTIPSVASRGRPKKQKLSKEDFYAYLASKKRRKPDRPSSSDPTQNPNPQTPQTPAPPKPERSGFPTNEQIQQQADFSRQQIEADRARAAEEADKFLDQYKPGLTDKQRKSYEESADIALNRELASARRLIDSEMGARGIQGGTAKIPKTELARYGIEAKQQYLRDLDALDSERAMENLIAKLAFQEGRVGQDILNRQQAFDYLAGKNASEENKDFLDRFYKDYYGRYPGEESGSSDNDRLIQMLEKMGFKVNRKKRKSNQVGSRI